jgi:hypothetical protein
MDYLVKVGMGGFQFSLKGCNLMLYDVEDNKQERVMLLKWLVSESE